jgi:NAD(P)-dependent dehydrogenase (short-subunit alcohol dehydrogenase family)
MKPLKEQAIVITGASSGIGRATALRLGREGASLVLAARDQEGLDSAASEARQAGGRAIAVLTDVSIPAQVQALADRAVSEYSRIDTWINNAGISVYSLIKETEPVEFERIVAVNLLGEMYGSRAALRQMLRQGSGAIINVASSLAERSVPLQAAYCASKHGVKGFTEALRLEAKRENPEIHVCLALPSSIDTPLFRHARSKVGVKPMPIPPVYDPEVVADALAELALHPKPHVVIGGSGKFLTVFERLSPGLVDWYMLQGDRMYRQQLTQEPDDAADNLTAPVDGPGAVRGEFGEKAKAMSVYTEALELHPERKGLILGLLMMSGLLLLRRR